VTWWVREAKLLENIEVVEPGESDLVQVDGVHLEAWGDYH
jgi:hypothetical protein